MSPAAETDDVGDKAKASVDYQEKLIEGKLESFENRVDDLQWTMTTILTAMGMILAVLGLFVFKHGREYKEAVAKAESEADKAEGYAKNARDWEGKAQKKYNDFEKDSRDKLKQFDEKAEAKFAELEIKAEEQLAKITEDRKQDIAEESEKQRELNTKWNEAFRAANDKDYEKACRLWKEIVQQNKTDFIAWNNWGTALMGLAKLDGPNAEKRFEEACEKYKTAISIKNDYHNAYCNWGNALGKWGQLGGTTAEMLFKESCEKLEIAVSLGNKSSNAYVSWGASLLSRANLKTGEEREILLKDAEEKLLKAEEIEMGTDTYNLACVYALQGEKDKCREWLKVGEEAGTFTATREHAETDKDLESVWGEAWFKEIRWKGEK